MFRLTDWIEARTPFHRYLAAILLAVAAQAARLPLQPQTIVPFITYAPFVVVSALAGGLGPGVLTTILCVVEICLLFPGTGGLVRVCQPAQLGGGREFCANRRGSEPACGTIEESRAPIERRTPQDAVHSGKHLRRIHHLRSRVEIYIRESGCREDD